VHGRWVQNASSDARGFLADRETRLLKGGSIYMSSAVGSGYGSGKVRCTHRNVARKTFSRAARAPDRLALTPRRRRLSKSDSARRRALPGSAACSTEVLPPPVAVSLARKDSLSP
jgi:hypothetical protein